jgi:hypothetical protein
MTTMANADTTKEFNESAIAKFPSEGGRVSGLGLSNEARSIDR